MPDTPKNSADEENMVAARLAWWQSIPVNEHDLIGPATGFRAGWDAAMAEVERRTPIDLNKPLPESTRARLHENQERYFSGAADRPRYDHGREGF